MNTYPSWIHRIPKMIEALSLIDADRIDRQGAERLFDLRKTAAVACRSIARSGGWLAEYGGEVELGER
jgi:hypothetical protein